MARLPRVCIAGALHLVVQRSQPGLALFDDAMDRRSYLDALREAAREQGIAVHAWGLLASEARLLATPAMADVLGRALQSVGRRFGAAFNRRHERSGGLWQGRYRAVPVDPASGFIACLRFVEAQTDAARASSAAHHLGDLRDPLVADHAAYWQLGNTPFDREASYRRLREQALTIDEVERIEAALRGGWPIGPDAFVSALQATGSRRLVRLAPGRKKTVPNLGE